MPGGFVDLIPWYCLDAWTPTADSPGSGREVSQPAKEVEAQRRAGRCAAPEAAPGAGRSAVPQASSPKVTSRRSCVIFDGRPGAAEIMALASARARQMFGQILNHPAWPALILPHVNQPRPDILTGGAGRVVSVGTLRWCGGIPDGETGHFSRFRRQLGRMRRGPVTTIRPLPGGWQPRLSGVR
jgi:hypothetical protein